ncbi:MAG: hypothetical protein F6K19_14340 [Cyanothece sp. SIO1E1]|nr:hypothetical protein [Cyanothece sp. SIO1E1]
MVDYTLPQRPDITLTVSGKDSRKAREKAMDQVIELVDAGEISNDLCDGLSFEQLIEVTHQAPMPAENEADVVQAVQILNGLATLKLRMQTLRTDALQIRSQIDILFTDEPADEAAITELKKGFKVLKDFAQANLRYKEARVQAEQARQVLDQALQPAENEVKVEG